MQNEPQRGKTDSDNRESEKTRVEKPTKKRESERRRETDREERRTKGGPLTIHSVYISGQSGLLDDQKMTRS